MNIFLDAISWLFTATNWTEASGISARLYQHIRLAAAVLLTASAIALPIGIAIGHTRKGQEAVAAIAGAARAIPTLGLLTLLGLILGIGLKAPFIVLVVVAIPPLLAGAYSGVANVDAATVKAARALGMSEWQIVRLVELPLSAPIVLGGVRTAAVQVVASSTLAAYIADEGLGRFIFIGLAQRRYEQMVGASVIIIILALGVDILFGLAVKYWERRTSSL
ncbi:MAG: ABC transporter permease [Actinomycetaceae bacterium]|nr:ABC transporter permease [Actinomycetaceae bacterium]